MSQSPPKSFNLKKKKCINLIASLAVRLKSYCVTLKFVKRASAY